MEVRGTI